MLDLLKVKHTKVFANRLFNEHPHKDNLFGLSDMLSACGIRNAATRITDKETDIFNIERIPVSQFIRAWSDVILLAETSPESIEPNYKEHRKQEFTDIAQKGIIAIAGMLIFVLAYISHSLFADLGISLLLAVNLIGVYICCLLVLKQLNIHSRYADKICSLFSKSDCNNVLELDAAKLWGVFGWSEAGLGYFTANCVILLFLPHLIPYLAIVNILALPYTFWSVWYQKVKARQWCPLCLIVQVLLWTVFVLDGWFGYIRLPGFGLPDLLIAGCVYALPVFAFNLLIPKLGKGNQVEQLRQEMNSIKANEEVFRTLVGQQPYYETGKEDSCILFGNPDARLTVTILTNPFCNPCAKMHARAESLLRETKGEVCVQYIFSSFNEDLVYANKYLIAVYLQKGREAAMEILDEWFDQGKTLRERFFENLQPDMDNPAIEAEFHRHESWIEKTQLRATPTIFVNGYKLPDNYKIEDLRYFTEFNFEIK
ncbi:MAG: thioredoxin domain-containing protein [Tannerellaceae bacterium]|nr:thioredoxin domain-containing protein [Tannerellaceae bacterium]